nr:transmembrane 9 superfamily member 3 [Quercus suber]
MVEQMPMAGLVTEKKEALVQKNYYFQMYYDDLTIWGFIGKTVLLLTGFLASILMRVLKNDFLKYAQDEEATDDQEETGWKYIHGDVFRFPKYKSLFAAAPDSGSQLFTFATAALPFGTIVLIWTLATSPLLVLGGIAGKNIKAEFQAPCRTTKYPREIPPLPCYRSTLPQMAMAGFLPFVAIYIELYYIFASVWGHRIYTIYSILFIVFIILLIVTAFITVALTYFHLAAEDHEWWWSCCCHGNTEMCLDPLAEGLFFVVDLPACLSMAIACIITMHDQICPVLCRPHFSLFTWLASTVASFSCLGLL